MGQKACASMLLNADQPDLASLRRICTGKKELHDATPKGGRGRICDSLNYPSSSFTNMKYTHVNKIYL